MGKRAVKVIFLDMDGVLNHHHWRPQMEMAYRLLRGADKYAMEIDPACADRLHRIVQGSGAEIVLSSSWRLTSRQQYLPAILGSFGIPPEKVIDSTPPMTQAFEMLGWVQNPMESYCRGIEIHAWLQDWPETVESFLILDDSRILFEGIPHLEDLMYLAPQMVQTTWDSGLEEHHVATALQILNRTGNDHAHND